MSQFHLTPVHAAYAAFVFMTILAFFRWRGDQALCASVFGGWLLLPVALPIQYVASTEFPYWYIGSALPSDLRLNKAVVIGLSALLGSLTFRRQDWQRLRLSGWDVPVVIWCLGPLTSMGQDLARALGDVRYLVSTWGALWILGRVHLQTDAARVTLLRAMAWSAVACLPLVLIEGVMGQRIYAALLEPHPFQDDGFQRYVGFRPLGLFENGNQYGIWVAMGAVAATVVWGLKRSDPARLAIAIVTTGIALASQSVGAILLGGLALGAWLARSRLPLHRIITTGLVMACLVGVVYGTGALPIQRLAKETTVGRAVVSVFHQAGRGSFTWRIAQDQKAIPLIQQHPWVGHHQWDWWRPTETRPWGLAMLIAGQFGAIGLAAASLTLLAPAAATLRDLGRSRHSQVGAALALVALASAVDALLNSFIYHPAIMLAGALASTHALRRSSPPDWAERWEDTHPMPVTPRPATLQ